MLPAATNEGCKKVSKRERHATVLFQIEKYTSQLKNKAHGGILCFFMCDLYVEGIQFKQ